MDKNICLFIAFFVSGCGIIHSNKGSVHSYYSDIDIYNMRGIGLLKINKPVPPCFEIDSVGADLSRVTAWYPKIGKSSLDYIKKDDCWFTRYQVYADTISLVIYKFYGKSSIVTLEFLNDSSKNRLKTATAYKDSLETIYRFDRYVQISPKCDIDFGKIADNTATTETINRYHIKNGRLEIVKTQISKMPANEAEDTIYYNIGDHSIFWWQEFGR